MNIIDALRSDKFKPLALIILSGTLYGFLGCLGTRVLEEGFSVSTLLFWRFLIASLWMGGISWWKDRQPFSQTRSHSIPLIVCALCYGLSSMFYFLASQTAGTGLSMVVFFSFPLFVALHTFYRTGWRADKSTYLALMAVPFGLTLLMERNSQVPNTIGIFFAVLSAVTYAVYIVKSKSTLKAIGPHAFTTLVCIGSAALFLILACVGRDLSLPTSLKTWGYLLGIGIFATAIPIQLLLEGLKEVSSLKASMASILEPLVTLLAGLILLNESITSLQSAGIFVVLTASIFIQLAREQ